MKILIHYLPILSLFLATSLLSNEPYDSIKNVVYEPYFIQDGYILLDKVNTQNTTVFIDVQSTNGAASRYVALNTPETVKVVCVNPWENDYAFQKFLSNVKQENQNEKIIPLRMNSDNASSAINLLSELIFIDGSTNDSLYEAILGWVSNLTDQGVICGSHWELSSVKLAVVQVAANLNLSLTINGTYWFLKKD